MLLRLIPGVLGLLAHLFGMNQQLLQPIRSSCSFYFWTNFHGSLSNSTCHLDLQSWRLTRCGNKCRWQKRAQCVLVSSSLSPQTLVVFAPPTSCLPFLPCCRSLLTSGIPSNIGAAHSNHLTSLHNHKWPDMNTKCVTSFRAVRLLWWMP